MSFFISMINQRVSMEDNEDVLTNGVEVQEDASVDGGLPQEGEDEVVAPVVDESLSDDEVEQLVEEAERSELIASELEQQNQAVQNLVETNGALTDNEAAMVEAARRSAVVGLGLDPDEGEGEKIVDAPGLESMVLNPGTISLEATTNAIVKIRRLSRSIKAKYAK